jgi:hypothetical protein
MLFLFFFAFQVNKFSVNGDTLLSGMGKLTLTLAVVISLLLAVRMYQITLPLNIDKQILDYVLVKKFANKRSL